MHPSRQAAEWLCNGLCGELLFAFLTSLDEAGQRFFRGFKVSQKSADNALIRRRVASAMARDDMLAALLLSWPDAPWQAWVQAVRALDEVWLLTNWRSLARRAAGRSIVAAMALDARPAVSARGGRALGLRSFWEDPPGPGDSSALPAECETLAQAFADVPPAVDAGESESLARRNNTLEHEIARLQQQLTKQRDRHRDAGSSLKAEEEKWRAKNRELRARVQTANEHAAACASEIEARVEERLRLFQREALGWTPQLQRARRELAAADSGPLLTRIDALLREHERLNEAYATRRAIGREIRELEDARRRMALCLEECVVVREELPQADAEAASRITELRVLLGDPDAEQRSPDLEMTVLSQIRCLALREGGAEELAALCETISSPLVQKLLGPDWSARLCVLLDEQQRIIAQLGESGNAPESEPPVRPDTPRGAREVWDVEGVLSHPSTPLGPWLFVDGYNAIKRVADLAILEERNGLAAARARFCALCRAKADRFAHVEIVFDGVDAVTARESAGGLTLVFAARVAESHNADVYLRERLHVARARSECVWLVTDDFGLRREVDTVCTCVVSPVHFYEFIRE